MSISSIENRGRVCKSCLSSLNLVGRVKSSEVQDPEAG